MIAFTDDVIGDIYRTLGCIEPEQGGAALGPRDANLITHFIHDTDAKTTAVTFRPSAGLTKRVQRIEAGSELVLKAIIHTHPQGSFDHPSSGDHAAFTETLERNSHMPSLIAPIGIVGDADVNDPSQLQIGPGMRMTCHEAWRAKSKTGTGIAVDKIAARIVPVQRAAVSVRDAWHAAHPDAATASQEPVTGGLTLDGTYHVSKTVALGKDGLTLLIPPSFPMTKPAALLTRHTETSHQTDEMIFNWSMTGDGVDELVARLLPSILEAQAKETPSWANSISMHCRT